MTNLRTGIGVTMMFLAALMLFAGLTNNSPGAIFVAFVLWALAFPIGNLTKTLR